MTDHDELMALAMRFEAARYRRVIAEADAAAERWCAEYEAKVGEKIEGEMEP